MNKEVYTKEDIIFYTEDLNVDELIGKECYFSNSPKEGLKKANEDKDSLKLVSIDKNSISPFIDEENLRWIFIIVKKTQYVPFKTAKEFIEGYIATSKYAKYYRITDVSTDIDGLSMWLTTNGTEYLNVTHITNAGIKLGADNMIKDWNYVFKNYRFLDGSYCGKKVDD